MKIVIIINSINNNVVLFFFFFNYFPLLMSIKSFEKKNYHIKVNIFTSLEGGLVNEYVVFPSIAKRISDSLTSL